jgi:hypothetical protein
MNDGQSNPGMDNGFAAVRIRRGGTPANTKSSHRKLARARFNAQRAPTAQRVRIGAERPRVGKPTSAGTERLRPYESSGNACVLTPSHLIVN